MDIKKLTKLSMAAMALVILAGCNGGGDKTDTTSSSTTGSKKGEIKWPKKTLTIAMIAKSNDNPVFQSSKKGAEDAAKKLKEETGIDIKIDWKTPDKENPEEQARRVQDAVNGGADVILISLSNAAKVTAEIDNAVAKDIPVMTFDSDAPDSKRFAFYGADDEECGTSVMKELAKITNGKANVAILAGSQGAPNLKKRVDGVLKEAKNYKDINIVGTFYHIETPQDAAKAVQQAMNANPKIDAWAMVGGWPLFTTSLLDLDPKKVRIVAIDCLPKQLPYIDKGVVPVLYAQPTYKWGYVSVEMIVDKMLYGKDPANPITKMELVRVSKDNLKAWAQQLKDWGFDDVDPKYLK